MRESFCQARRPHCIHWRALPSHSHLEHPAVTMLFPLFVAGVLLLSARVPSASAAAAAPAAAPANLVGLPEATTPPSGHLQLPAARPTYTTKYDNINVDMIVRNEHMLRGYMDCLMDRKPCSKEGKLLKEIIPDALQTDCASCSPKQKEQAGYILAYLLQHKKDYWNQLISKYDPEGTFRKRYEVEEDEDEDCEED